MPAREARGDGPDRDRAASPSATPRTCRSCYRDFNLTIEPGQSSRSWGRRARGKSTLAKLLQGFYPPTDGAIKLDGHDIRHLSANELRQHFGVVPQETMLFSGTIYDNLVMANPHASFDRGRAGVQAGRDPRDDRSAAAGLPDRDRRARRRALRRAEAAHRDRPRAAQAAEDPDLRRGHQRASTRRPPSSSGAP